MIAPIDKALGEGNCMRVTECGKEAGCQSCEATNRNVIQGRSGQASGPNITNRTQTTRLVNGELVQRKITFLSGEICPTYLGVGLARKPGPCMRKQLGVGQKSAGGIVVCCQSVRSIETLTREGRNSRGLHDRNGLTKARRE